MTFKKGDIVELSVPANVIPAGRYRFEEECDEILIFSVCDDITIGLARGFWGAFLKKSDEKAAERTPASQFVRKYSKARKESRNRFEPVIPERLSFCFMSPRYGVR